jgi:hypothetical protein
VLLIEKIVAWIDEDKTTSSIAGFTVCNCVSRQDLLPREGSAWIENLLLNALDQEINKTRGVIRSLIVIKANHDDVRG